VLTPGTSTPDTAPAAAPVRQAAREAGAVGTGGIVARTRPVSGPPIVSLRAPESNDGIWIRFLGEKWVSAGAAVPYVSDDFTHVGEYGTFPVFRRRDRDERIIYIPTRAGLVAPYGLKRD
jgi:hypothetical protein